LGEIGIIETIQLLNQMKNNINNIFSLLLLLHFFGFSALLCKDQIFEQTCIEILTAPGKRVILDK
jgi:hypothetical protein